MSLLSGDQILANILVVWVIQRFKKSKLPFLQWINFDTVTVNKIVATLGAILTTAGITFAWIPDTGTLAITGLTMSGITTAIADILKNYAFQHVIYKAAFKPDALMQQVLDLTPPAEIAGANPYPQPSAQVGGTK